MNDFFSGFIDEHLLRYESVEYFNYSVINYIW